MTKEIGYATARVNMSPHWMTLVIMTPACTDEGAFTPAASVDVTGIESVKALRDFLNEVKKAWDEKEKAKKI